MADAQVIHIGENSPEHVAYVLMQDIALMERLVLHSNPGPTEKAATRQWVIDTYLECWRATHGIKTGQH